MSRKEFLKKTFVDLCTSFALVASITGAYGLVASPYGRRARNFLERENRKAAIPGINTALETTFPDNIWGDEVSSIASKLSGNGSLIKEVLGVRRVDVGIGIEAEIQQYLKPSYKNMVDSLKTKVILFPAEGPNIDVVEVILTIQPSESGNLIRLNNQLIGKPVNLKDELIFQLVKPPEEHFLWTGEEEIVFKGGKIEKILVGVGSSDTHIYTMGVNTKSGEVTISMKPIKNKLEQKPKNHK